MIAAGGMTIAMMASSNTPPPIPSEAVTAEVRADTATSAALVSGGRAAGSRRSSNACISDSARGGGRSRLPPPSQAVTHAGRTLYCLPFTDLEWMARMAGNTLGTLFTVTTAGESHGPALVAIVDGCPPGLELTAAD